MTAVIGAVYPTGVCIAADSFRVDSKANAVEAIKVIKFPTFLFSASGSTTYSNKVFGEILAIHKALGAAFHEHLAREHKRHGEWKFEEEALLQIFEDYMKFFRHLVPSGSADVLLGFPSHPSFLLKYIVDQNEPRFERSTTIAAAGNAMAYIDYYRHPHAMPKDVHGKIRTLGGAPPMKGAFQSKEDAEGWASDVVSFVCKVFPATCAPPITVESHCTPGGDASP
ncbi:MAG: hypothetical protein L6Q38_16510 [Nitrospira sp.]|nr:hypothetical protein [Nitrospira sp.]